MATFPIGQTTFPTGDTPIPARAIPVGTSGAVLTLDVSGINKTIGQSLVFNIFVFDGTVELQYFADFDGPWRDKSQGGAIQTTSSLIIQFGTIYVDGIPTRRLSAAGWTIRGLITAIAGPIISAGGSLSVS